MALPTPNNDGAAESVFERSLDGPSRLAPRKPRHDSLACKDGDDKK
ncbi:uncharacterized protein PgNI_07941 [Pyricularia grisea]|uniref:Uncharacterized protein n=1 Tax=Pyricularia grisea TaxID=148305 RepID=A0A6P8B1H8_PYRGI|nr:uncharacterized protein PgNI_07941 [Pyricularia grisea]TLD08691.1 hypothetical protein PgNI_07941 [Pyricularia grisea]